MTRGKGCLTRRQFIKGSLILLAAPGSLIPTSVGRAAVNSPGSVSTISLSEGGDPYATAVSCIEGLGGMSAFVNRGDSILLKPNIGWDRRVEQGANTHPEVVRAVGEMCLEAGAHKVIILDRTCNDARRTYRTSGMQDMVKDLSDGRISLDFVRDNRFVKTDIPRGITEDGHPWVGAESPELTIIEFSDYLCFQCKKIHYYLRRIVTQNPTKIRLVHRHFPMDHEVNFIMKDPFHIGSGKMALAAIYSVSKGKFWEMNDLLFELAGNEKEMNLNKLASKTSLDSKGLARAIYSQKMRQKLKIDIWTALKARMIGTPSYLIDGKVYQGQLPPEILKKVLN